MNTTEHPSYTIEDFEPLLSEVFAIGDGTGTVEATLVEVTDLREAQGAGRRSRQFSLVWRGPPSTVLAQKIYSVAHPVLGVMDIFLVTIGSDAEGTRYEAVFT